MPLRRNEDAAVEITALAAGAGPPANRMATRRIWRGLGVEGEGEADILNSRQGLSLVRSIQRGSVPWRGHRRREIQASISHAAPRPDLAQVHSSRLREQARAPDPTLTRGSHGHNVFWCRMANRVFPSGSSSSSQPWTWASRRSIVPSPPPRATAAIRPVGVAHEMERRIAPARRRIAGRSPDRPGRRARSRGSSPGQPAPARAHSR